MAKKHTLKDWIMVTRPWSFTASGLTVVTALVYLNWLTGAVDWGYGWWAVGAIILFHAAGNTWSDYHDFRSGVDTVEGAISIPTLREGIFTPKQVRNLSLILLALAVASGVALMYFTGWWLLAIGIGGILCTLCYPYLKYRALGDLVILLAYGFLPAIGTSFVALGHIDWRVLWVALPVGLLVDAILHANNTRDMATDRRASIRTMAHGLGLRGSVVLYVLEVLFPFVWVAVLVPFKIFPLWSLMLVAVMRVAMRNSAQMRAYKETENPAEIATLDQRSAQLQMLFCLVMIASLLLDGYLKTLIG